jgi:hypothetical protein
VVEEDVERELGGLEDRVDRLTGQVGDVVSEIAATSFPDRFARCEAKLDRLGEAIDHICQHLGIASEPVAAVPVPPQVSLSPRPVAHIESPLSSALSSE